MKKILTIALMATLLLTGCKDFLVEKPTLTQSNEMSLSDYNGLVAATAGAYGPLVSSTWYGANFILDSEIRADNAMNPLSPDFLSGRMTTAQQMNYNESATSGLWSYAYYVISAVNNVLEAIETNGMDYYTGGGVEEQDIKNIQAECYFLRALAHFDLVRLYAHSWVKGSDALGVPVILKTDKTAQEKPARNTVAEVYTQVVTDLTAAETLMDPSYTGAAASGASVKANVSLPAVQALLARAYLYKQDWNNAAAYATKVIENGSYKLWTAKEYTTVWSNDAAAKGGEVIFEVYGRQSNDYDGYWEGPSHMTNPEGYADCAASWALVDLFEAGDVRGTKGVRTQDEKKVMFCTDSEEKSGGQFWTMKYQGKGLGDAKSTPDQSNTIVLRLSEMYLIRAEAGVNGAPGVNALADLNAIRANRGATPLTAAGNEAVAKERRMELNFEGHLWFDLARTNGSIVYDSRETNRNTAVLSIASDSHFWALPIPKRETDVNENLVQNSGY